LFKQKSEAEHFASLLKSIVIEGGKLARGMRQTASVEEKADKSLVTEADLAVTDLVKNRLEPLLKQKNHILIDEESAADLPNVKEACAYDYQWVLDPIDGTAPYSAGLPFYAVSLGLMRKGEPWLGAAYMPDLDEVFWTDGKGDVLHQVTVSGAGKTYQIQVNHDIKTYEHTPYFNELFGDNREDLTPEGYKLQLGSHVCAVLNVLKSNAAGFIGKAYIWDNAAVMALAKTAGFDIEDLRENIPLTHLNSTTLNDNWLQKNPLLIAPKENMAFLRKQVLNKQTQAKGK
jgi:fructose-1,6-bisphosphatase/inositol monophosphatase family enzyme